MAKYSKNPALRKPSKETETKALAMAKSTQRPGQNKEQTKLIAQGIQKGIDQYKKQQKEKARELDRKLKQLKQTETRELPIQTSEGDASPRAVHWLGWLLFGLSWLGFIAFELVIH
jgi:seryl-tRNA synthetase